MDILDFILAEDSSDDSDWDMDISSSSGDEESEFSSSSDDECELQLMCLITREKRNSIPNYLQNTFADYTDTEFRTHFRITRELFSFLTTKFKDSEMYQSLDKFKVYSPEMHIALFLWFAGHEACCYRDIADRFNVSISTVHAIISRVIYFISGLSNIAIRWPNTEKKAASSINFGNKNGFFGAIGAIDGTHIKIDPPKSGKDDYINRKNVCSLHMQAICDENRKFCEEFYILGDSAYACSNYVITPYPDNGHLSSKQKYFNKNLSSARVVIDHTFGILKQRFRQLYYCKIRGIKKLCHFIRACVVLHNLANDDFLEEVNIESEIILEREDIILPERSSLRRNQICEEINANKTN